MVVLVIESLCDPKPSLASSPPRPLGKVKFNAVGLTVRLDVPPPGEVTVRATVVV